MLKRLVAAMIKSFMRPGPPPAAAHQGVASPTIYPSKRDHAGKPPCSAKISQFPSLSSAAAIGCKIRSPSEIPAATRSTRPEAPRYLAATVSSAGRRSPAALAGGGGSILDVQRTVRARPAVSVVATRSDRKNPPRYLAQTVSPSGRRSPAAIAGGGGSVVDGQKAVRARPAVSFGPTRSDRKESPRYLAQTVSSSGRRSPVEIAGGGGYLLGGQKAVRARPAVSFGANRSDSKEPPRYLAQTVSSSGRRSPAAIAGGGDSALGAQKAVRARPAVSFGANRSDSKELPRYLAPTVSSSGRRSPAAIAGGGDSVLGGQKAARARPAVSFGATWSGRKEPLGHQTPTVSSSGRRSPATDGVATKAFGSAVRGTSATIRPIAASKLKPEVIKRRAFRNLGTG